MKKKKKMLLVITLLTTLLFVVIWGADYYVKNSTKAFLYDNISQVPHNNVGLLLGTIKTLNNGNINRYYQYRIDATVALYNAGKIDYVLVSGDNSTKDYDEPTTMMEDLVKNGIPSSKIFLDYAGFRTLDSVVRGKEIFGQHQYTIISQKFHNERAIFIANHYGIKAIGFAAKGISGKYGIKVQIREKLARVKVVLDLIFGVSPKFLGEQIEIK